jgi:hypothetical protein
MPAIISLRTFVDEMDAMSDESQVYLNRHTGEFLHANEEMLTAAEGSDDGKSPEWMRADLPTVREAIESEDWLELPSRFDIDEYRIMRDFCGTLEDKTLAADLYETIGGKGTFGRFKGMLDRHGLLKDWFEFRQIALTAIAMSWLEVNGFKYTD